MVDFYTRELCFSGGSSKKWKLPRHEADPCRHRTHNGFLWVRNVANRVVRDLVVLSLEAASHCTYDMIFDRNCNDKLLRRGPLKAVKFNDASQSLFCISCSLGLPNALLSSISDSMSFKNQKIKNPLQKSKSIHQSERIIQFFSALWWVGERKTQRELR